MQVQIGDRGPGLADEALLTIARNIAAAHGGSLLLRNRPEGGLDAVLTLPRDA